MKWTETVDISEKSLNRNILRLALPAAGENLLHMTVFITDAVLMAWVGVKQLAAVDMSAMIAGILMLVVMAVSTAATSLVARNIGAQRRQDAERIAGQSLLLGFAVAIVVAIPVMIAAPGLMWVMGLEPAVAVYGTTYLRTVMWGAAFRQIISGGCSVLRGAGDTFTPMLVTLLMNIVNIGAAVILVFGLWGFPRLEVFGAALAANLAALTGAALVMVVLLWGRGPIRVHPRDLFTPHWPAIRLLARIGVPAGLEMFVMRINFLFYLRIIAGLGTDALAANAVALRVESLSFMPGMGIAAAAMTLVGQSLGAGQAQLAEKSRDRCVWVAVILMSALGVMLLFVARPISALFVPHERLILLSALCIQISALEQPFLGFVMVHMGALRGAGDTVSALIVSAVCSIFVRLPIVFLLAHTAGMGLAGAWLGAALDWAIRSLVVYTVAKGGRWKRVRLEMSNS